jgi:hypothetical protein
MTGDETMKMLRFMASAWPNFTLPPQTAVTWAGQMQSISYAEAMEAATQLQRTEDWFPTMARFIEVVQAVRRRGVMDRNQQDRVALTEAPWPSSGKSAKEWIEEIRAKIATAQPWRQDPKTGEKVLLPKVPGFRQVAQDFGLPESAEGAA